MIYARKQGGIRVFEEALAVLLKCFIGLKKWDKMGT
jgi:hypothetical protein